MDSSQANISPLEPSGKDMIMPHDPIIFQAHDNYVLGLLFAQKGAVLISSGMDSKVNMWSTADWRLLRTLDAHAHSVNCLSLSRDEKTLATGSTDATVKLWDFPAGTLRCSLQDRKKTVAALQIARSGDWVAAASYGGRVAVWSLEGEPVVGIGVSKKNLGAIAMTPDGRTLATAGLGDDIWVYALPSGEPIATLSGHKTAVRGLRFIAGGSTLVSLGYEQTIKFWDTSTWETIRTLSEPTAVRGFAFSANEQRIALSLESMVQIRATADWALLAELPVSTKVVNGVAFSPDGRWFAAGAADRKIRAWRLQD